MRLTIVLKRISNSPIKLWGMQGFPQDLYTSGGIDPSNVIDLVAFTDKDGAADSTFEISNVRVYGKYEKPTWAGMTEDQFFPFIDEFGQFRWKDWPGKVHAEADLLANRDAEAKELQTTGAGPAEWDKWGGWAKGPTLEATGHFHTGKYKDKWWLIDPDGHLFFSVGLTGVGFGGGVTPDRGSREMVPGPARFRCQPARRVHRPAPEQLGQRRSLRHAPTARLRFFAGEPRAKIRAGLEEGLPRCHPTAPARVGRQHAG